MACDEGQKGTPRGTPRRTSILKATVTRARVPRTSRSTESHHGTRPIRDSSGFFARLGVRERSPAVRRGDGYPDGGGRGLPRRVEGTRRAAHRGVRVAV